MYHCISHGNCMLHRFHGNKAHYSQDLNSNARGREETIDGFQNVLPVSWICIKIYQEMLILFKQLKLCA